MDIDDEFEMFMRRVNPTVPQHCEQYRESRRVFFAGAAAIFFHVTRMADSTNEVEGVRELDRLQKQLVDFTQRVVEEKD